MDKRPVVLVTGAGTGVGAAVARRFASAGWDVVVQFNRSADQAQSVVGRCKAAGARAIALQGDVADDASCRAVVANSTREFGRLDALVNNAGVTKVCPAEDLEGLSAGDFQQIYAVNVVGAYQMTRAALAALRESPQASIVNVSSQAAFSGLGSSMAYAASKAALNTLTLALARSLAPRVRVNAVCPGYVNTRWARGSRDDESYRIFRDQVAELSPLKRMTEPEEVADVVYFLSSTSAPVTGELVGVDAGTHLTVNAPSALT
jgi:3-oxoacyl-[acyl-carrier protein] reductase